MTLEADLELGAVVEKHVFQANDGLTGVWGVRLAHWCMGLTDGVRHNACCPRKVYDLLKLLRRAERVPPAVSSLFTERLLAYTPLYRAVTCSTPSSAPAGSPKSTANLAQWSTKYFSSSHCGLREGGGGQAAIQLQFHALLP